MPFYNFAITGGGQAQLSQSNVSLRLQVKYVRMPGESMFQIRIGIHPSARGDGLSGQNQPCLKVGSRSAFCGHPATRSHWSISFLDARRRIQIPGRIALHIAGFLSIGCRKPLPQIRLTSRLSLAEGACFFKLQNDRPEASSQEPLPMLL